MLEVRSRPSAVQKLCSLVHFSCLSPARMLRVQNQSNLSLQRPTPLHAGAAALTKCAVPPAHYASLTPPFSTRPPAVWGGGGGYNQNRREVGSETEGGDSYLRRTSVGRVHVWTTD